MDTIKVDPSETERETVPGVSLLALAAIELGINAADCEAYIAWWLNGGDSAPLFGSEAL